VTRIQRLADRIGAPPILLCCWISIVTMTLLSIAYTAVMTYVFHLPAPYGLPIFYPDDRWFDFTIYHDRFQLFGTAAFWQLADYPFTYPAPLALLYAALYTVPHALRFYLVGCAAVVTALVLMFRRTLVGYGVSNSAAIVFVLTLTVASYPLRMLFESANTEGICALITAFGAYFVLRDRVPRDVWLGASLIALAGSMKIFPLILLALLLSKRRYFVFASSLVFTALLTVASLAIVGPSVTQAQLHIDDGIRYVKDTFILSVNPEAATFNHSLFVPLKFLVVAAHRRSGLFVIHTRADFMLRRASEHALLDTTFSIYLLVAAAFGFIAYFVWIRRIPLLNQLLALTVCSLILPPLSADYTLLHLFFPFALLCLYAVEQWRRGTHVAGLSASFFCFPAIFSYQTYFTWHIRFSCEVRTLAMLILLLVVLRYPFAWRSIDDASTPS
jgi:hypothetical protein